MPCPGEGPCQVWDLDLGCCLVSGGIPDPCLGDGTTVPQELVDSMVLASSQFMWAATGRQFGCCTVTIRPCRKTCDMECCIPGDMGFPWMPVHLADGTWTNISCGCKDACSCTNVCSIDLPYPVCSVDEVVIDGETVPEDFYRVDEFKRLVRLGVGQTGLTNSLYLFGPSNTANTADGGTFEIDTAGGLTGPIPWDASTVILQGIFDALLGLGNSVVTEEVEGQPLNSGFYVELVGIFAGGDVPGFVNAIDASLVTGPDAPYAYPFGQLTIGGEPIIGPEPHACWPECNDLTKNNGEEGTWSVTLTYGKPVPELVRLAANEFACQLIKKCLGKPCDLPQRIQSINRQGMSATFLDPMEFMSQGMTGIFLVDLAIKTYNPHRLYRKPLAVSPDSINKWTVTTWVSGDPTEECT